MTIDQGLSADLAVTDRLSSNPTALAKSDLNIASG